MELIEPAHHAGVVVIVQIGDVPAAREAAEGGADILVALGVEAGGHVQGMTPLSELLRELRPELDLPCRRRGC